MSEDSADLLKPVQTIQKEPSTTDVSDNSPNGPFNSKKKTSQWVFVAYGTTVFLSNAAVLADLDFFIFEVGNNLLRITSLSFPRTNPNTTST